MRGGIREGQSRSVLLRDPQDLLNRSDTTHRVQDAHPPQGQHPIRDGLHLDVVLGPPFDDHAPDSLRHRQGLEDREAALVASGAARAAVCFGLVELEGGLEIHLLEADLQQLSCRVPTVAVAVRAATSRLPFGP